jgi:hypothetical protein
VLRSLLVAALAALTLAGAALAAYPTTYAAQGGRGVLAPDGAVRFVATAAGAGTRLAAVDVGESSPLSRVTVRGSFGIPTLGDVGLGMFRDGKTLVLQSTPRPASTTFLLVRTADLSTAGTITLAGTWAFDALSPDGSRLYLIRSRSASDLEHYVVRAYDLAAGRLLPGRIADKTQRTWVMQGFAITRAETPDGRWVYTLYSNPSGFPFVHALDTVRGVAHCVGFAWRGEQGPLWGYHLAIRGGKLLVRDAGGAVYRAIDRTTWAVGRR